MKHAWLTFLVSLPLLADFETKTIYAFGPTPPPKSVEPGGGVVLVQAQDPLGGHGDVAKVTWPAWGNGKPEWPAIYFRGASFSPHDWRGWDGLRVVVLNPTEDVVDLGLCLRGNGKRYNVHRLLQPNVWNAAYFPMADIVRALGKVDGMGNLDLFMTRPPTTVTLYVKSLDLVRFGEEAGERVPLTNVFGDFETDADLARWTRNGIRTERVRSQASHGEWASRVTYPKHTPGNPPWPALQAWAAKGTMPEDWTLYRTLAFDVHNPGPDSEIKLCLRDRSNKKCSRVLPLAGERTTSCQIDLAGTGLDLAGMRQCDLYLTRPDKEQVFIVDAMRLVIDPKAQAEATFGSLRRLGVSVQDLPAKDRAPFATEIAERTRLLRASLAPFGGETATATQLNEFRQQLDGTNAWLAGAERDVFAVRCRAATAARVPGAPFGVGIADSMTKVMIRDLPLVGVRVADEARLELAANEYESLQLVVLGAERPLQNVTVTVSELRGPQGVLPGNAVEVALVGYVKTKKPPYEVPYVGWWPDPILDFQQSASVEPGEAVPFWIRVHPPEETPAGAYTGSLTVSAAGAPPVAVPFMVHVFGFAVPTRGLLPTATDFRDHIRQVYGKDLSEADYRQKLDQFRDLFATYKIDLDRIYRGASNQPEKVNLYLDELKNLRDRGLLNAFNICYVGTKRDVMDVNDPNVQATIDKALTTLRYWVPILRREGLLEYAYVYGYDEVPEKAFPVMAKVYGAIKAEFPDMPLMTTAYDHSFGGETVLRDVVDIHVPLTPRFDPERVAATRARGNDVWWYICIGPKHPYANWLIEYPAIETRLLMGLMTAKYRPGGFLYYALTRWPVNKQPIVDGPYTNWNPMSYRDNNGDGSIFCAGPDGPIATIRAENFRDGMEDYAYFRILEDLVKQAEAKGIAADQLRSARAALQVSPEAVVSLKEFTHDPAVVRAERRTVAHQIENLQRLLKR
jgi:hypothetical protein